MSLWFTLGGALLIAMTLSGSMIARLPISSAMLCGLVAVAISPAWLGWYGLDMLTEALALERLAEVVVLLSLFTSGLKLSAGLHDRRWIVPLRLAVVSMLLTVGLIALAGVWLLGLSVGAAVLLGGILAPTDPVLASDVQVADADDRDAVRFALTAEGGLNDGTAFPVVMLGLGLLGVHELGDFGWRWVAVDVVWSIAGGVAIGGLLGTAVGQAVLHLRRAHKAAVGLDNFLALGLIGMAYGVAQLAHAYGFLAVFAAGAALRRIEQQDATLQPSPSPQLDVSTAPPHGMPDAAGAAALATDPTRASAYLAHAVLSFNEQLDRLGEVVAVVAIGLLLWRVQWLEVSWPFVALTLLVIRPASVAIGLFGARISGLQRGLIGWFGIRGIGSVFYLAYAVNHGISPALANSLMAVTLSLVTMSIIVHGISVTPLMSLYRGHLSDKRSRDL